jgi:hypothetical protein
MGWASLWAILFTNTSCQAALRIIFFADTDYLRKQKGFDLTTQECKRLPEPEFQFLETVAYLYTSALVEDRLLLL